MRGPIPGGTCYIFAYRDSSPSQPPSNFVYCKISFVDPTTTSPSSIDAFSPCFTTDVDGNYIFDLDDSSTPIQKLTLPGKSTVYNITSIQPIVCNVSSDGKGNFSIIGSSPISVVLSPDIPVENPSITHSSLKYSLSMTSKLLYFESGNSITYPSGNTSYQFSYIKGSGVSEYPLIYTSSSPWPFKLYFLASSFVSLSNGICSNSFIFSFSTFDFLFPFAKTPSTYEKCVAGTIPPQNSNCAFTTVSECNSGYYYDYCSDINQCGTCFGTCKNSNPCRELTQAEIAISSPMAGFTCNAIPVPPTPQPIPVKPSSDNRIKKEVMYFLIAAACIVALGLFLIYLLPGKAPPKGENESVIPLKQNYTPPGYVEV